MNYLVLLRGINVGGKRLLPMKSLVAILENLGCEEVRTYIQSGNAVFRASAALAADLPAALTAAIFKNHGFETQVVLRSAAQVTKVLKANPFLSKGAKLEQLHVGFLAAKPQAKFLKALDPRRSPGDVFEVLGAEIYMCLTTGMGKTKLSNAYFDKSLETVSTFRNWATVNALAAMLA